MLTAHPQFIRQLWTGASRPADRIATRAASLTVDRYQSNQLALVDRIFTGFEISLYPNPRFRFLILLVR